MPGYVESALFIYSDEGRLFKESIVQNPHGTAVRTVHIDELRLRTLEVLRDVNHVVVSAELAVIKEVMRYAMQHEFSLGFLPLTNQKALFKCYRLPKDPDAMLSLALKNQSNDLDIVFCNDQILLFKGSIGRIPLVEDAEDKNKFAVIWEGLKKMTSLRLLPFTFSTSGSSPKKITTAASGCLILENPDRKFSSMMTIKDTTFSDGLIATIIVAPFSIIDYIKLLLLRLFSEVDLKNVPDSIGYIKSSQLSIDSDMELNVTIDGSVATKTPAHFHVQPAALRINHGLLKQTEKLDRKKTKEKYVVKSLPVGKELQKAGKRRIPFFTYASEERFNDLFVALRDDARLDKTYVVLMVLSTVLATVGLYLNSASVIIGAMLLAPLMAPIISMAMSLLRYDKGLFRQSLLKIIVGIIIALFTSAIIAIVSPYQPFTGEMQGRLNPTVLDLVVAIAAGVAGAYTKSFKEILQSLAGVAIAVALVPPLAVAGIGLGRFDLHFFSYAFLLFSTNLIGIVLAATFTFRVLGFSAAVRDKRGVGIVLVFLLAIFVPLFIAYQGIVERTHFEKGWEQERFLINGKYLIVKDAILHKLQDKNILTVEIHARDQLTRRDLNEFRRKVQNNFTEDVFIRANVTYIP